MRKEKTVTLDDRGNKLTFKIREMSASDADFWQMRAFKTIGAAGINFSDGFDIGAVIRYIINHTQEFCSQLNIADVRELLNELVAKTCSRIVGKVEEPCTPETIDDYIVDVRTRWELRREAIEVSFGFFAEDNRSESRRSPSIQLHETQA